MIDTGTAATHEAMVVAALSRVHPEIYDWLSGDIIRAQLKADLDRALRRCSDRKLAARSAKHCPVKGTSVDDYLGKLLELAGHRTLLSPRFLGLDAGRAFVQLEGADFPADDEEALAGVLDGALDAYSCFSPESLRVALGSHQSLQPAGVSLKPDLRVIAGPLAALAARPKPPGFERMSLTRCADTSFHTRYRETYEEIHAARPELSEGLYTSMAQDLAPVVEQGHFYEAWIDEEWAGIVAAAHADFYGVSSFLVHEELLAARFRGCGLGVVLQRHLIEKLIAVEQLHARAILFGTIHPLNKASVATAKRIGRIDIGGYYFLVPRLKGEAS